MILARYLALLGATDEQIHGWVQRGELRVNHIVVRAQDLVYELSPVGADRVHLVRAR